MKKIKSIDILNFKVFRHREFFELNGKNLLVYGTNGSGKSSLFWAIYTFLQSIIKPEKEVEKYFDPEDNRNLRNIFSKPTDPSFIKITFLADDKRENSNTIDVKIIDNPDYNQKPTDEIAEFLNKSGTDYKSKYIKAYTHNTIGDSDILKANTASDFINYRLLLNFYNASHRDQTDLIHVFTRDVFPFFNNPEGESLSTNYYDLYENPPKVQRAKRKEIEKINVLKVSTNNAIKKDYDTKREKFNRDLESLFNDLNKEGNEFLKTHFTNGEDKYRFEIGFSKSGNETNDLRLDDKGDVCNPYITLNVWQKDNAGDDKDIWRPHSFLNEAKLTQLALSIRLAALKIKLQKLPSLIKTLVVDDLLISLDMSNRLIVLEIILKEFSEYQLIILTHDKSFFDMVGLKTKEKKGDWVKLEFYDTEDEGNPIIKISEDYLPRAEKYKNNNEFDLAAVMLRKKAENILKIYLDPDLKQLSAFDTKDTLSDFLIKAKNYPFNDPYKKFIDFIQKENIDIADLENYDIKNTSLKPTVTGKKINEMVGFLKALLNHSETQLKWLKDSAEHRTKLNKIIDDMNDLSSRVLNPGAHASTTAMYKREIEEAITVIKAANATLGLPSN